MNSSEYYSDQVPFTGVKKQRINIKLAVLITVVTMVVVALLIWAITTTVLASRRNPIYPNAPVVDDNPLILDIITYNDVYELNPVSIATPEPRGGCSRVATYIKSVKAKKKNPSDVLVLFGGDLISPSLMSTIFKGKQMIVANNMMGLNYACLGNHEYDYDVQTLTDRFYESKFTWINSNVRNMPFNAPENIIHMYGKQKIGLFGVLLQFGPTNKSIEILDPYEVAAVQVQSLKAQGATFIIALSHMAAADNCELAKVRGIDLIVSGHDHQVKMSKDCGDAAYVTASQDWQDIWHIRVNFNFTKPVFQYNSIPITADLPTDPDMDAMINSYEDQIKKEYSVVIARTTVELEGRASEMRSRETNLGNFICDEMRTFGNTTISYFNGGSIRCNKIYPANSDLTKGSIVDMMPFSNKYTVVTLNGTILMQMLEHGVSKVDENSGRFPIFSGLRVVYNLDKPVGSRIISVQFQTPNGYANLQANSTMTVMTSTFLTFGGDDYSMMVGLPFVVTPEEGVDLQMILMQRVTGKTISPTLDGRMTLQK